MALGYGLSLRLSEYLVISRTVDEAHYLDSSSLCFLQWPNSQLFIPVGAMDDYLARFLAFLVVMGGKGGPRPSLPILILWDGFVVFAPSMLSIVHALLIQACRYSLQPRTATVADELINRLLKQVAVTLKLDPSRLLPHGIPVAGPVFLGFS
jgi:hypothetical protein